MQLLAGICRFLDRQRRGFTRAKSKVEQIAPECTSLCQSDERLAQIAKGKLAELIHQTARAATAVRHGNNRRDCAWVMLERGEDGEWARSTADGDHPLIG